MMKIFITLILSLLGAICYRLGGIGKPFNTKYRDIGVPLCGIGIYLLWGIKPTWVLLLHFFLCFGAMTTYWDKLFGFDNFYFHGFMAGMSALPLYWIGIPFYSITVSAIICGMLMGLWSKLIKEVNKEEYGRGFIYCITRLLLFI